MMKAEGFVRFIRTATLVVAALAATAGPAAADGYITPYLGYNFGGDSAHCATLTNCEEKHANFGVSLGSAGAILGFEEDIGYAKNFFMAAPGVDNNVFHAMSNLLVGVFAGPVQPYVLVGAGLIRTHVSLNPTQVSSDNNALGYDLGGGVSGFFSPHVGVRGDIRHFHTLQDVTLLRLGGLTAGEKLDYWRASVGVAFKF